MYGAEKQWFALERFVAPFERFLCICGRSLSDRSLCIVPVDGEFVKGVSLYLEWPIGLLMYFARLHSKR